MTPFNVAIVGVGLVGEQVVHQLTCPTNDLRSIFRIKSLHTSNRHLRVNDDDEDDDGGFVEGKDLIKLLKDKSSSTSESSINPHKGSISVTNYSGGAKEVIGFLNDPSKIKRPLIVIDCTSSQEIAESYPDLLKSGIEHEIHIVTPNKKAFSGSQELFDEIERISRSRKNLVFKEATVGAGLPVISTLRELVLTGDRVKKIEGILSGTMSYIFNRFSQASYDPVKNPKSKFSEVVKLAQSKGYTEPNPADDLDGSDVSRKLTILFRNLSKDDQSDLKLFEGHRSVKNPKILPDQIFESKTSQDFLRRLEDFDDEFEKIRSEAFDQGCLLRFVGIIDLESNQSEDRIKTCLAKYPFDHPFSSLTGSDNILAFYTDRYNINPLIVRGSGAGSEVTAMGVVGDMIKVAERLLGYNI